mmetsp:Transcript_61362/g.154945  ORF Transcript_61362/g.154945 Transcript_61362/m.154945 type:complete len:232 (-) Transcript_61362:1450-2145(-)
MALHNKPWRPIEATTAIKVTMQDATLKLPCRQVPASKWQLCPHLQFKTGIISARRVLATTLPRPSAGSAYLLMHSMHVMVMLCNVSNGDARTSAPNSISTISLITVHALIDDDILWIDLCTLSDNKLTECPIGSLLVTHDTVKLATPADLLMCVEVRTLEDPIGTQDDTTKEHGIVPAVESLHIILAVLIRLGGTIHEVIPITEHAFTSPCTTATRLHWETGLKDGLDNMG